jgi:hypothetical protein
LNLPSTAVRAIRRLIGAVYTEPDSRRTSGKPPRTGGAPSARPGIRGCLDRHEDDRIGGLMAPRSSTNVAAHYDPRELLDRDRDDEAPTERAAPRLVWTGSKMNVRVAAPIGDQRSSIRRPVRSRGRLVGGGRHDTTSAPSARGRTRPSGPARRRSSGWAPPVLDVVQTRAGPYDPQGDSWTGHRPRRIAPTTRDLHTPCGRARRMVVWGSATRREPRVNTGGQTTPRGLMAAEAPRRRLRRGARVIRPVWTGRR